MAAAETSEVRNDAVVVAIVARFSGSGFGIRDSGFGKNPIFFDETRTPDPESRPSGEVDADQESCDKEIEHEDPHRSCDHRPRGRASDALGPAGGAQPEVAADERGHHREEKRIPAALGDV